MFIVRFFVCQVHIVFCKLCFSFVLSLIPIMGEHNSSNKIKNKLILFYVYHGGLEYICMKLILIIVHWKMKKYFKKIEMILNFYKIYFTCDSMFVNHVKSLIIFISQMEFFWRCWLCAYDLKIWQIITLKCKVTRSMRWANT